MVIQKTVNSVLSLLFNTLVINNSSFAPPNVFRGHKVRLLLLLFLLNIFCQHSYESEQKKIQNNHVFYETPFFTIFEISGPNLYRFCTHCGLFRGGGVI